MAFQVRIARIFNTYGPRMCIDDGRVVSNFVAQALRKEPLTVYGDGKQTRSFQYVSDLVKLFFAFWQCEKLNHLYLQFLFMLFFFSPLWFLLLWW